jgi:heme/copper-type cytochrome/quinol oxidase subunit 3
MVPSWSKIARFVGIVTLCALVAFSVFLASHAYQASREVGAGAAQGDLGFFMVLMVVSPVVLLLSGASWWLGRRSTEGERNTTSSWANLLVAGILLGLCWSWFYLFAFWRA